MAAVADLADLAERFMLLDIMMFASRHGTASFERLAGSGKASPADKSCSRLG
jgi:hypothetical protein